MAPFKLKFRMGGSSAARRNSASGSQDHDHDPQVNEALLDQHESNTGIAASSSTIDSVDCNSLSSIGTHSERKLLLPIRANSNQRSGCSNQNQETSNTNLSESPPPSPSPPPLLYEVDADKDFLRAESVQSNVGNGDRIQLNDSQITLMLEQLSLNELNEYNNCAPHYVEGFNDTTNTTNSGNETKDERRASLSEGGRVSSSLLHGNCNLAYNPLNDLDLEERKESIDSQEFLLSDTINDTEDEDLNAAEDPDAVNDSDDMVDKCTNLECRQYMAALKANRGGGGSRGSITTYISNDQDINNCVRQLSAESSDGGGLSQQQSFQDPLTNYNHYCDNESHQHHHYEEASSSSNLNRTGSSMNGSCTYSDPSQAYECDYEDYQALERSLTPEITSNKSSKEIYRDLAKQWGLTCKLSDGCRCMDCQSNYFDCEFEENEHQKTDGGLGAGTPMFISEVMHGTACNIL